MARHFLELDIRCRQCDGTGVYKGLSERGRVGVVCIECKGTGCERFELWYDDFESRVKRGDIDIVLERSCGVVVDESMEDIGGMAYADWVDNKFFPPKSEGRKYICPLMFYRESTKEPVWKECSGYSYSDCPHYETKSDCWDRFDKEQEA